MAACESGIDLGNSIPFDFVLLLPLSFTCPVFCPGLKISFGVYGVEGGGGWTWVVYSQKLCTVRQPEKVGTFSVSDYSREPDMHKFTI